MKRIKSTKTVNKIKSNKRKTKKRTKYGGDNQSQIFKTTAHSIKSIMGTNHIRLAKLLNVVCKNSGNCLALGVYGEYIKRFFDDFRNINDIDETNIKKIGNPSANGFILELPFVKNDFKAKT